MASPANDQSALLKEVLEAVKALQVNQTALASNVDAISGRVNVLAGMKEVRDAAAASTSHVPDKGVPVKKNESNQIFDDDVVPQSPSLPATQIEGAMASPGHVSHAKKPSVTSRIILTWVSFVLIVVCVVLFTDMCVGLIRDKVGSIRYQWIGVIRILNKEVLLWSQEAKPPSGEEMVRPWTWINGTC
jgi:hypothetical protein